MPFHGFTVVVVVSWYYGRIVRYAYELYYFINALNILKGLSNIINVNVIELQDLVDCIYTIYSGWCFYTLIKKTAS